eukprot:2542825-Prymnesium_polylepis.2
MCRTPHSRRRGQHCAQRGRGRKRDASGRAQSASRANQTAVGAPAQVQGSKGKTGRSEAAKAQGGCGSRLRREQAQREPAVRAPAEVQRLQQGFGLKNTRRAARAKKEQRSIPRKGTEEKGPRFVRAPAALLEARGGGGELRGRHGAALDDDDVRGARLTLGELGGGELSHRTLGQRGRDGGGELRRACGVGRGGG